MPRRGFVPKREVLDDPIYGGKLVTKLINQVMQLKLATLSIRFAR